MTSERLQRTNSELSDFLTRCRARVSPDEAGLPATGRRRTPGLRREEVAALAGVGLTWYTWFEQGRDIRVSEAFLLGVASALRLDDAECNHLFLLAHNRPPPPESHQPSRVRPLILRLLDELGHRPAYILDPRWDVVAWNDAAEAMFGFRDPETGQCNLLRTLFTRPHLQQRLPGWREDGPRLLKQFRFDSAFAADDPLLIALVDELRARSADFRRWWKDETGACAAHGPGSVLGTDGGSVNLQHETLLVDEHRRLRLVVFFVDPPAPPLAG